MQEEDNPFKFKKNLDYFTIGVELEVQILNRDTFELFPISPSLFKKLPKDIRKFVKPEFIQSMVEITTGVCSDITEVKDEILITYNRLEEVCSLFDAFLFVSSLHPFSKITDQRLFPDPRYKRLLNELQQVGRRFISQGLHVHVGVKDEDMAIRVYNAILVWLPVLLAISASSPFYQGRDTGFASYRSKLFKALPLSGMPEPINSWNEFLYLANSLKDAGIISSIRDLWWDVRPHPSFGTVEIRICDVPMRFNQVLAVVALIQALVCYLAHSNVSYDNKSRLLDSYLLKYNKWQAARYGMDAKYVSMVKNKVVVREIKEVFKELIDRLIPYFDKFNSSDYLRELNTFIIYGSCAEELRELREKGQDFKEIIAYFKEGFFL